MKVERCMKQAFAIIGKEGSTQEGDGFIQRLWKEANSHFHEVAELAQRDSNGMIVGIWGAMSDFSHSFRPWEDGFSKGLYLAGVECPMDSKAPEGWTKWVIPGYEYVYTENDGHDTFSRMIAYLKENQLNLAGAAHEFTCPKTGKEYLYFPIKRL
ncbi:MAG: GyrI-like domain-containing protein [Ruminococcaceae bacterium]|nr:GyrI-like domain-containing protein [Oscillospiraceae bacterium]HHV30894.1 GyrI-like domain-containing protein [Clostridiales bacterium]